MSVTNEQVFGALEAWTSEFHHWRNCNLGKTGGVVLERFNYMPFPHGSPSDSPADNIVQQHRFGTNEEALAFVRFHAMKAALESLSTR